MKLDVNRFTLVISFCEFSKKYGGSTPAGLRVLNT
jgi:hypothetical protein